MKHTARTGRRKRSTGANISMFPFLAVLVCTMGALIVLLVVITRQSRLTAAEAAAEQRRQQQADLQAAQEMAEWRVEQLRNSEQQTDEQLEQMRAMLGHLEDHARELQNELEQIREAWEGMKAAGEHRRERREHLETELGRLQAEIERAREQLADAERAVAEREPRYAIVPYEGPNQTRRQPIYLECTGDAVILWPEAIRFPAEDFEGPLGPGNPLAAAIRAKREYLLNRQAYDPSRRGEPYPLMIVRPDGVASYVAARDALSSWKDSFGYELVPADWEFEFPVGDAALKAEIERAIAVARQRQRLVAAAAPRHRRAIEGGHGDRVVYRAAPGGGVMVEGAAPDLRRSRPTRSGRAGGGGFGDERFGAPGGVDGGHAEGTGYGEIPRGGRGYGDGEGGRYGGPSAGEGNATEQQLAGVYREQRGDGPGAGNGGASGEQESTGGDGRSGNANDRGEAGERGWAGTSGETSGEHWPAEAPAEGMIAGRSGTQAASGSGGPGEQQGQPGGVPSVPSTGGDPASGASVALRPGEWRDPGPKRSLADGKGRDWALRGAAARATPITRPIRIECHGDRLVVASQPGGLGEQVIAFNDSPADAAEQLVDAVWNVLDVWGIAGRQMYWQPVLKVNVADGAERRLTQLQQQLDGSGLIIEADKF